MCELARRPEYLSSLREELVDIEGADILGGPLCLTEKSLLNARRLDSFVREVLRLNGGNLRHLRVTTCDAPLGGFIIPRGGYWESLRNSTN